jgi:three-Cys-motif partner protein
MAKNRNEAQFDRYREWQWIKHFALGYYVSPWSSILGSFADELFVYDAFAGAGTYDDPTTGERTDGSPPIFAQRARQFCETHPGKRMQVICTERNPTNFAALRERMDEFGDLVKLFRGGFERHVETVHGLMNNAPALILLDPIGLKTIPADVCQRLTHRAGKTDLFIILHFGIVHRTAGLLRKDAYGALTRRNADNLDAVFNGGMRWRTVAADPALSTHERELELLDIYFKDVLGPRYPLPCAYGVCAQYGAPPKYWLVQASASPKAFWLMNNQIVKLDDLLYERTQAVSGTLPLREVVALENEARRKDHEARLAGEMRNLVAQTPTGATTFGYARDRLVRDFFGLVTEGGYARAARHLVEDGAIRREKERLAAKFDDGERLSLPRSGPSADAGRIAIVAHAA